MLDYISLDKIFIGDRQRKDKSIDDLLPSIRARGIVSPLIVKLEGDEYRLIAGERRYLCAKELKLEKVPCRLFSYLTPIEQQIIELEENLYRKNLDWKEFCPSVANIHKLHKSLVPSWTQKQTADSICMAETQVSMILAVAEELEKGTNKQILSASGYSTAYNVIVRRNARRADDAFSELMEDEKEEPIPVRIDTIGSEQHTAATPIPVPDPSLPEQVLPVQLLDFREWAASYKGPYFNFIHCDFPYGIGLDRSDQGNTATWGGYADSGDTYWNLVRTFCVHYERFMAPSSHLMFWLSADIEIIHKTLEFFQCTDLRFNPKPLIWHKSDNRGILPDPKRGPRHVYEAAIFASRGDRFINQSVSDAYSSPAGEKTHQSEKSEAMLRHFFRMFVDDGTRFLDPTCGAASSLRAAESLGATVTGLEINPDFAEQANSSIRKARIMRRLA